MSSPYTFILCHALLFYELLVHLIDACRGKVRYDTDRRRGNDIDRRRIWYDEHPDDAEHASQSAAYDWQPLVVD